MSSSERLALRGGTPVRSEFLPFATPLLGEAEEREVVASMRSGWLTTGPRTRRFEQALAQRVGAPHAVALSSCTAALHLSLILAGVGPGDEVITSPITFASTANVILHCGAKPVFADVRPETLNLCPDAFEACITERTKAVIPVHLAGLPCRMDRILSIAAERGIMVIEDAAQAINAAFDGKPVGSLSPLTCFSFYATKNVTTGEGGALVTDSEELMSRARIYALHGMSRDAWKRYAPGEFRPWKILVPGYKYNMGDLQASIGLHQLEKLDELQARRDRLMDRYERLLAEVPCVTLLQRPPPARSAHHMCIVLLDLSSLRTDRNGVATAMQAEKVGVGVHFEALHLHPYYAQDLGYAAGIAPVAEDASARVLSLPLYPRMSDQDQDQAIEALSKVIRAYRM